MRASTTGSSEVLDRLRADGHRLATATSKGETQARLMLDHFGLADRFEVVGAASMDGVSTTKPEVLARTLDGLGNPDPDECLLVGDRRYDVAGAAEHGIRCIGAAWGYGSARGADRRRCRRGRRRAGRRARADRAADSVADCDARPVTDQQPRAAVDVENLVIRYGDTVAVDGISFTAEAGAVTAVLGPNGAGKTSTLEHLEGYRNASSGHSTVLGLDPRADHRALSARVGLMLQDGGIPTGIRPPRGAPAVRTGSSPIRSIPMPCSIGSGCRTGPAPRTGGCPGASSSACRWHWP